MWMSADFLIEMALFEQCVNFFEKKSFEISGIIVYTFEEVYV